MILAIVKQQLRQIGNISRFRFAIAGLLSIITKYKNNLKSRAHKECMAKIGRYVERALDRLTVTTMLLCRDSALKVLARKARSSGLPFCLPVLREFFGKTTDADYRRCVDNGA